MTDLPPPDGREPDADEPDNALAPLDPLDDAASATIDGVEVDPAAEVDEAQLAARIEELSAVRSLLADPVTPPDPSIVDAQIAAALGELDPPTTVTPADAAVVPLAERRHRPALGRWLAVAAAIAVIALAIPIVSSLSKSTSKSSSTAASAPAADNSTSEALSSSGTAADAQSKGFASTTTPSASTFDATAPAGDIGTAETASQLTSLVEAAAPDALGGSTTQTTVAGTVIAPSTTTTAPFTRSTTEPLCVTEARARHPELGALLFSATATYRSIPVAVAVFEVPDPVALSYRLVVSQVDGCGELLYQPYP